jgi:prevent-host-death family protein
MTSVTLRELKNNPATMTAPLQSGDPVFVTKHGKPIGVTVPLGDAMVDRGIKELLYFDLYEKGEISFGKLAEFLQIPKSRLREMFGTMGKPVIDYTPKDVERDLRDFGEI